MPSICSADLSITRRTRRPLRCALPPSAMRSSRRWHFLYFLPLPHQHGSLRPGARSGRSWASGSLDATGELTVSDIASLIARRTRSGGGGFPAPERLW
jgi:hypothetical protein